MFLKRLWNIQIWALGNKNILVCLEPPEIGTSLFSNTPFLVQYRVAGLENFSICLSKMCTFKSACEFWWAAKIIDY